MKAAHSLSKPTTLMNVQTGQKRNVRINYDGYKVTNDQELQELLDRFTDGDNEIILNIPTPDGAYIVLKNFIDVKIALNT